MRKKTAPDTNKFYYLYLMPYAKYNIVHLMP